MRMLTGTLVPSFEVAISRTTSASAKLTFVSPASAVFASFFDGRRVAVPGGRREVALAGDEDVVAAQALADRHGGDGLGGHRRQRLAGEVEHAQLRRPAHDVGDVQARLRRRDVLDGGLALGHDHLRLREVGMVHRHREHLAARRVLDRERVEAPVEAQVDRLDLVGVLGHARPLAGRIAQVERELAAVAVGHGREQVLAVARRAQLHLGDARKLLADHVRVGGRRRAELVVVDLLVEVGVLRPGARCPAGSACSRSRRPWRPTRRCRRRWGIARAARRRRASCRCARRTRTPGRPRCPSPTSPPRRSDRRARACRSRSP